MGITSNQHASLPASDLSANSLGLGVQSLDVQGVVLIAKSNTFCEAITDITLEQQRDYQISLNDDLAHQNASEVFARNLVRAVEEMLNRSSQMVERCLSTSSKPATEQMRWLRWSIEQIGLQKDILVDFALRFNRSSSALANFPKEHYPSGAYLARVLSNLDSLWNDWCAQLNRKLV
ncbi:hypothetical protein [Halioxenophilus aromaticivorans]|uniref:Uncharacterized protein n=1 Tax=Halioxenophilus aromaticivorans TaxID=1306992 RepID=A0AAV3U3U2_9ALTE